MKNFGKNIFEIWIENFRFWILKNGHRKWKKLKNHFEIWKTEICHKNLKRKNWNFSFFLNLKFFIFEIWNENFRLNFLKNWPYHQMEMRKQFKWRNHIFLLCHRDKTYNNTPIPPIPPMHTTIYHMCKLWWYTINLSRRILSYWSFFNSGIGWYGPP
jgi:hypothetical protein